MIDIIGTHTSLKETKNDQTYKKLKSVSKK